MPAKIYSKFGDQGESCLAGRRTSKSDPRLAALGAVDELSSALGLAVAPSTRGGSKSKISAIIFEVQNDLFVLGAIISQANHHFSNYSWASRVKILETQIDAWQEKLPPLHNFILPGGSDLGARLHLARAICRRAERQVVAAWQPSTKKIKSNKVKSDPTRQAIFQYVNRLSDWLFVLARWVNYQAKIGEKKARQTLPFRQT
ncbi:MAG: ATP:cob(I)alamin adenosyltransferase [Candidatus Jacksonbacteria bacterium RIFOXYC2_FULL_44_29]|nr:MAG: hypothetical protein UW45_C0031G0002 [Parcubacteria group bacterium GW2011_GWC2_44_22]OGY75476.1 MAG: ATP:cob(I)alamin adenosyltransferase [Candidatus Jacksonbacteria bacterium RIFOXYA2_FULL_43_12]OGY76971.1 MAG: ATP:cob(I)alamin adenosyltransferase [Candidatus Jacksonbacteria bacterium RIFOXYB2_FULL_44_15]OGY79131.1 MAG: ATP:cob(I)alamin adenosyltransferase [Candidatus Jacksonbacteria bacterium RIFOXYD2_FULL_43_21]OGY80506.1 MAG: ATP:cob(I)alamin adenosyltransferase [Candidatus Jackson